MKIISGFKGTVDFYINHQSTDAALEMPGIPCARRWPRSPGHRRAPSVEAQWPVFTTAVHLWNTLSQEVRDAYKSMVTATGLTGRDLFIKGYISGIYTYPH